MFNALVLNQEEKRTIANIEQIDLAQLPEGDVVLTQQGEVYQLEISWQESQYSDDSQSIQHYPLTFRLHEPR